MSRGCYSADHRPQGWLTPVDLLRYSRDEDFCFFFPQLSWFTFWIKKFPNNIKKRERERERQPPPHPTPPPANPPCSANYSQFLGSSLQSQAPRQDLQSPIRSDCCLFSNLMFPPLTSYSLLYLCQSDFHPTHIPGQPLINKVIKQCWFWDSQCPILSLVMPPQHSVVLEDLPLVDFTALFCPGFPSISAAAPPQFPLPASPLLPTSLTDFSLEHLGAQAFSFSSSQFTP